MTAKSIKINVGGTIFETTEGILLKSSYFKAQLERFSVKDKSKTIFVDRSPHIFKHVLSLMRDSEYAYPDKYIPELVYFGTKRPKTLLSDGNSILFALRKIHLTLNMAAIAGIPVFKHLVEDKDYQETMKGL